MSAYRFINALRILNNIERFEGEFLATHQWPVFRDYPFAFMMRADDETLEKVWAVIESHQP